MKCQLSPPPYLCYDGQYKNVSLLVVDRDIQRLQTNAKVDHNATEDNRKSYSINRDKTENISLTFQAKAFLYMVHIKTLFKSTSSPVIS